MSIGRDPNGPDGCSVDAYRPSVHDRARIITSRMCHFLGGRSLEALRELAETGVPDDLRADSPELRAAIRDEATRQLYEDPS